MRLSREKEALTQAELARRLDCSQQAIAQADRFDSNPTVDSMRRWGKACGVRLSIKLG